MLNKTLPTLKLIFLIFSQHSRTQTFQWKCISLNELSPVAVANDNFPQTVLLFINRASKPHWIILSVGNSILKLRRFNFHNFFLQALDVDSTRHTLESRAENGKHFLSHLSGCLLGWKQISLNCFWHSTFLLKALMRDKLNINPQTCCLVEYSQP